MARTLDEILAEASQRPNPVGGNGLLLRSDIIEALQGIPEPQRQQNFNYLVESAVFLTPQEKQKVKTDYLSY